MLHCKTKCSYVELSDRVINKMLTFNVDLKPNWIWNIGLYKVKNNNIYNTMWIDINILSNSTELIRNKDYMEMFDWKE